MRNRFITATSFGPAIERLEDVHITDLSKGKRESKKPIKGDMRAWHLHEMGWKQKDIAQAFEVKEGAGSQ